MAGWRYLRYFRLQVPLVFPWHGQQTTRPDMLFLVSESTTGIFGFRRALIAWQSTSAGVPGLYYQHYTGGVSETPVLVQAFSGQAVAGTLTIEHRGTSDGRSRVTVSWEGTLLEDATVDPMGLGTDDTAHHMAVYVLSDPMYAAGSSGGLTNWAFAESVRVGTLAGCAYGEPDSAGQTYSRGARSLDWQEWWADMAYSPPGLAAMSAWFGTHRGVWAGYVFPGAHFVVNPAGYAYADATTDVRTPPHYNDSLQFYLFGERPGGSALAVTTDRAYRTKLASVNEQATAVLFRLCERAADRSTWSAPVTAATGDDLSNPALAAYDDGAVTCWYMAGAVQHATTSSDDGRTWQELTGMMGSSLRNVSVTQHHGITLGVGVQGGQLYFVRSNDQGRTQDAQPGGSAMQLVGPCGDDCRPCIAWYPNGEVAVWAENADGKLVTYSNSSSGYGAWAVVP